MHAARKDIAQSMLDNAVGAFVSDGGKIVTLPGFEFKPLPLRSTVQSASSLSINRRHKRASELKLSTLKTIENDVIQSGHVKRIVAMASLGLSVIQISNRTSVPRSVIRSIAKQFAFEVSEAASSGRDIKKRADAL